MNSGWLITAHNAWITKKQCKWSGSNWFAEVSIRLKWNFNRNNDTQTYPPNWPQTHCFYLFERKTNAKCMCSKIGKNPHRKQHLKSTEKKLFIHNQSIETILFYHRYVCLYALRNGNVTHLPYCYRGELYSANSRTLPDAIPMVSHICLTWMEWIHWNWDFLVWRMIWKMKWMRTEWNSSGF